MPEPPLGALEATIERLDSELGTEPVDATATFTASTVRTTPATTGRLLDEEEPIRRATATWPSSSPSIRSSAAAEWNGLATSTEYSSVCVGVDDRYRA